MRKNIIFKYIIMVAVLAIVITALSLYNLRNIGIKSAIHNAEALSEVIKSGLTSHMLNNNMHQVDTFIDSVSNIKNVDKIWLVRGDLVSNQFKNIDKTKLPKDALDKSVLLTGKMQYEIQETFTTTNVRVTIPYNAIAEKNIDCLQCHNVKQGETLGAVSLMLDISTLKQIGIESIYIISLIVILTIVIIIFLSRKILRPYISLFNRFSNNINCAVTGKFNQIQPPRGITSEMLTLTQEYNKLIVNFRETSVDIEKKLQGFIGYNNINNGKDPLNDSKEIIDNLSNLYQFKKEIELDNTRDEIYARLSQIFLNKFGIKNFSFVEIDMLKQKMSAVVKEGNMFHCEKTMSESPELCRAARTKSDVMSMDFHSTCPYFENKDKYYYCTNIDISKNIYLIINFVFDTKEELENLKEQFTFIKSYINEAAPSLEVKLLMNALKESAFRDGLTGLYNRKFLEEHTKKLIPQAKRENINVGVLMLDMDHFKAVNDEYGHDIGDKVLKELARILDETVRESDLVIRYGGEEFIVLLVGVKSEEDTITVANKIGQRVRENEIDVYAGAKLKKTISIGVSMFPQDSTSFNGVVKNADIALYEAKSTGRDKVVRFKEEQVSSVDLF
ncbi:GGDEF domain-containing protein [Poseidonibacter lekithochrous]|uniref:GGDEF domain-containing protein n=1 Tax=Poseidonibacter lekithochrous TaxID=1904463 RepID=UPI0008FCC421|nr:GGDEF domain-containing protein [Poseidonibacter lekithochrous]QKJ22693.1 diguanylate cyclase [Poseidonibacter lekithochrous]